MTDTDRNTTASSSRFQFGGCTGWRAGLLAAGLAEVGWFGLLYPLWPRNLIGLATEAALLVPVLLYGVLIARLIRRVDPVRWPIRHRLLIWTALLIGFGGVVLAFCAAHLYLDAGFGFGAFRHGTS